MAFFYELSVRVEGRVPRRTLRNSGRYFEARREQLAPLAQRIEQLANRQGELVLVELDAKWEDTAQRCGARVRAKAQPAMAALRRRSQGVGSGFRFPGAQGVAAQKAEEGQDRYNEHQAQAQGFGVSVDLGLLDLGDRTPGDAETDDRGIGR